MEQLEVLSKSYLVRWVQVSEGHTISWSIQPHKKSLNFGLFKHPGGSGAPVPNPGLIPSPYSNSQAADSSVPSETQNHLQAPPSPRRPRSSSNVQAPNNRDHITASTAQQKLESLGLRTVVAPYKCPADVVTVGTWDVKEGHGGNFALVFDNTFSKQVSKTATFVLLTYLTHAPPTSGLRQPGSTTGSAMSLALATAHGKPEVFKGAATSSESLATGTSPPQAVTAVPYEARRPRSRRAADKAVVVDTSNGTVLAGVMHKRRRKHNSYAKRFFSLDCSSGTLSYYKNRQSSALRGAIPLSLAVVSVNDRTREISVDSGAEIWHLRVGSQKEFDGWKDALEKVSSRAAAAAAVPLVSGLQKGVGATTSAVAAATVASAKMNAVANEQEWVQVEALIGRVVGIRDAVRRLAKDTDPKYLLLPPPAGVRSSGVSPVRTPSEASFDLGPKDEGGEPKRPFWKRKASSNSSQGPSTQPASGFFKRSVSAQHVPTVGGTGSAPPSGRVGKQHALNQLPDHDVHDHCMQIMHDLDHVVTQFSSLLSSSKQRRRPQSVALLASTLGHHSSRGSMSDDEFFDAHDGNSALSRSQLLEIRRDSRDFDDQEFASIVDDGDSSGEDNALSPDGNSLSTFIRRRTTDEETSLFPRRPKSFAPLPISTTIVRRKTVAPPKVPPPSLIAFFRKNVGKDLSTIAMPVSANEPLSALQRISEQLEYSSLLDSAAAETDQTVRLLWVATFAISSFSSNRAKERAVRKPFNPMLGETFELVREDRGFRLLAEKICHRPVRMAVQAESSRNGGWTFFQCSTPTQKFWGKSAELNTEGRARVIFHELNEIYSYELATSFLRNVIAGEKYVEPVSTMTILCETTGVKAVVAFRAGGMFAGRSEEVSVQCFDERGNLCKEGLAGKWTTGLGITRSGADDGRQIWKVGELVENAGSRYGFTLFAAQMNDITELEKGKMASTDSRLRPDQRELEEGRVDEAEALKAKLEESQRNRRKVMEENGEEWKPKWFMSSGVDGDEEVWKMKSGREGYWEAREKGNWAGLTDVFEY